MMTMPVQPANNYGGGMGMWGDNWIWIIVLFLFGWGGNGFGRGNNGGVMDGYVLTSDFANLERKLDGVNNGQCDGFYAQAQLINGVQQSMNNGFMTAEVSRANQQAAFMQQLNAIQAQAADCCCKTQTAIQGVNYNLTTQECETRNTIQNGTRDIIENQNSNARAILDAMTAQRIEAKDAKIAVFGKAQVDYVKGGGGSGDILVQKAPACTIKTQAEAVCELFGGDKENIKVIGIRHGEKMYETLLTNEECARAEDLGSFYRGPCDKRSLNYDKYFVQGDTERNHLSEFNSNNTRMLDVQQVKEKLLQLKYIRSQLDEMGIDY